MNDYGSEPMTFGVFELDWSEYMLYQYLPIRVPDHSPHTHDYQIPERLRFSWELIRAAVQEEDRRGNDWSHVYVTAKRGFATPGNPLNRPGWHTDGFGTMDVNYVWVDRFPTWFASGHFGEISDDHILSVQQFERRVQQDGFWRRTGLDYDGIPWDESDLAIQRAGYRLWRKGDETSGIQLRTYPDKTLVRLDRTVVHAAPEIPAPGGERSFFKISFSNDRYDLLGNAHNYLLKYDWPMVPRGAVRNDPASAGKDSSS